MIFPFKITNTITNSKISDLWFSLSKSQTKTQIITQTQTKLSMSLEKKKKKKKGRERGDPVETRRERGGAAGLRQWGVGTNGAVAGGGDAGMTVIVTEGKSVWRWGRGRQSGERTCLAPLLGFFIPKTKVLPKNPRLSAPKKTKCSQGFFIPRLKCSPAWLFSPKIKSREGKAQAKNKINGWMAIGQKTKSE